tara:strand:- start:15662 stop:16942 length:1281 start_codon:yes stop_codon:yes gene_type:complete
MTINSRHILGTSLLLSLVSPLASAAFLADGKGSLELRNQYFNRDFRDSTATQSKREEWGQGFILRLESGYTEGTVGFGLDAIGMLGLKLDSSPDRTGTGLLSRDSNNRAEDNYSKAVPTFKAKLGESVLRVGGLSPVLPLLASNASRLFPQVYDGTQLVSSDLDSFTFTLGRIGEVKQRDSSNFEELSVMGMAGAYSTAARSDQLWYGNIDFHPLPNLTLSYHLSELEDIFRRDFMGFRYSMPLTVGKMFAEARYFDARDSGKSLAGEMDNRTLSTNLGYSINGHTISGGYQKVSGDTAYTYIGGSDTYLFSEMQASTFAQANERVYHARYDYDFAQLGVPGLTFRLRYVKGDEVDPSRINTARAADLRASNREGKEWERSTDIIYVVQKGTFKDVSFRWRNATNRSNYANSVDENRVIVSYVFNF